MITMKIKGLVDEDFVNYKLPCMYICTARCSFKCDDENHGNYCQNSSLALSADLDINDDKIIQRYLQNDITKAICFSGLEPLDQFKELTSFIRKFRNEYKCDDMIVIYSGYNRDEIPKQIRTLQEFPNIIIKFGRYYPGQRKHKDEVLGVKLASKNQYAEQIS